MGVKNDIPHGYKQTELGIIPEDWEVVAFKDLGSFSKGSGISRAEANTGRIPCIRYGELYTHHNDYVKSFNSFISQEVASKAKLIKNGDILFAASGETKEDIGKSVAYTNLHEAYAGGDIIIVSTNSFICDAKYIGYASNAPIAAKQKATRGQGDAVVHITTESIKSIAIPLPPLPEQKAIAKALSDVDDLIAALDKKIAKKRLIKQGAMQQLLTGKKRLPGFTEEWVEIRLGDHATMNSGGTPLSSVDEYYNGNIPFLSISDITNAGKYVKRTEKTITEKGLNNSSARMFPIGTIMYAMYASLGKTCIAKIDLSCSQAILGIKTNSTIDSHYLYYCLSFIEEDVKEMGQTGTQSNLSKQIVQDFILNIPYDIKEQQKIANILSDIDKEILYLETKRDKYRLLKSGMMQRLLTGKIRLKTK